MFSALYRPLKPIFKRIHPKPYHMSMSINTWEPGTNKLSFLSSLREIARELLPITHSTKMEPLELITFATEMEIKSSQSEKLSLIPMIRITPMPNLKSSSQLLSILKPITGLSDWTQAIATQLSVVPTTITSGFSTDLPVCPKISTKKSTTILRTMASQLRNSEELFSDNHSNHYFHS